MDRGTDVWTDGRTDLKCAITEKIGNLIKILNIEKKSKFVVAVGGKSIIYF